MVNQFEIWRAIALGNAWTIDFGRIIRMLYQKTWEWKFLNDLWEDFDKGLWVYTIIHAFQN